MLFPLASLFLAVTWLVVQAASPPPSSPPRNPSPPPTTRKAPATPPNKVAPSAKKDVVPPVLEGLVKDPTGKPVKDARVLFRSISERFGKPTPEVKTDTEGRFRAVLGSGSPVNVRVEAPGLAAQTIEKVRPGAPLLVTLARGRALEGTVRDAGGQPVVGARVFAVEPNPLVPPSGWDVEGRLFATTDARGRYRIEGIGPGLHSLSVTARGYGSASRNGVRPGASVDLALVPGGGIAGFVTDPAGGPLRGALVRAESESRSGRESRIEAADANGRFEILGLGPGSYTVVARHPDFAPAFVTAVAVEGEDPALTTLVLTAGATVTGRLVGPEERPAAGRFELQELGGQALWSLREVLRAETGPDGAFRVERVPPGSHAFLASARGLASQRIETQISPRETVVDLGDLILEAGLSIRGRVRAATGAPVADAQVWASPRNRGGVVRAWSESRSEADGSFAIGGLDSGTYGLSVHAAGFASIEGRIVTSGADDVDLVLVPGGSVTGVVVDERGRPSEGYAISAHPSKAEGFWDAGAEETVGNADGRFLLEDLSEGTYVIQVAAPDYAPAIASDIKVVAGGTADAGVIRLARGGVVRGSVLDTAGLPVVGAAVSLGADHAMGMMSWTGSSEARTDPAGAFEIRGVPAGSRTVTASHADYAEASTQVEVDPARGPTEARLTLPRGGRIEGVVRGREGAFSSGLRVRWSPLSGPRRSARASPEVRTGADGSFVLDHVNPGPTEVTFFSATKTGRFVGAVRRVVEVREAETTTLEVVLREILVTGRVSRRGGPLAGATVRFSAQSGSHSYYGGAFVPGDPPGPQRLIGVSGEDGSFELIVDEPGRYRVTADTRDGRSRLAPREVQIPDAESHAVELAFGGASVSGVVVDAEKEQPVAGAHVGGRSSDGSQRSGSAQTAEDGRFELDAEIGDYVWTAYAEGYATAQVSGSVSAAGGPDLRFELRRGLDITGRLLDAATRPVAGLELQGRPTQDSPDQWFGMATSLPDGSFRLQGLPPGSYNLCAGSPALGYAVRPGVTAGARDVTLTLRPGGRLQVRARLPDGSPAEGAYASIKRVGSARVMLFDTGARRADASGQLEMSVPAGALEIEVGSEKFMGTLRVQVGEGTTMSEEIRLTEPVDRPK